MSRRNFSLKKKLRQLNGFQCGYCGYEFNGWNEVTLEHIIPRFMEGPTDLDNCILCCDPCNQEKNKEFVASWPRTEAQKARSSLNLV